MQSVWWRKRRDAGFPVLPALAAVGSSLALLVACGGGGDGGLAVGIGAGTPPPQQAAVPEIRVLSNRPDLVSGGDALVEVVPPKGVDPSTIKVDVDGRDVTGSFAVRADARFYGLVSGLKEGKNVVKATLAGKAAAALEVTNYPIGGPVISGPQVKPWNCTTKVASPTANNPDLGDPVDDKCNVKAPVYRYQYRTLTNTFATYDPANPPATSAIATTTTDEGKTVPYIVRIERGVINRGKYDIAYLANPSDPTKGWEPWNVPSSWNRKLFWKFGSGCEYGRTQGSPGSVMDDVALKRGFMVASSEMTQYGTHCNDVTSAETVIMIKEYIADHYGQIRFTMSDGGSGGAHQQNLHSSNYPGLIQGMLPSINFQDTWTPGREFADCGLLKRYYDSGVYGTDTYSVAERTAISGHRWNQVCEGPASINMASRTPYYLDPQVGDAGCGTDPNRWSPSNPAGIRCTLQDFNIAIFGPRDGTGYAKTPMDNIGIQYGLAAFQAGRISAEKFVKLNENIGGYDINGQWIASRMQADPGAVEITHASGRVSNGKGLGEVAIIDERTFDITEEHYDFRTWVIRNRILKEYGDYGNQVIWRFKSNPPNLADRAFETMNQWLMNVQADTGNRSLHEKLVANRPAAAVDSCWRADQQVWSTDAAYCNTGANPSTASSTSGTGGDTIPDPTVDEWPVYRDTRVAAGEPLTSDIMKCQLKPLVRADYIATFTDAQWNRLKAVFPNGVCDYSKPGQGQVKPEQWQTFKDGPGGKPLGPVPVSAQVKA